MRRQLTRSTLLILGSYCAVVALVSLLARWELLG